MGLAAMTATIVRSSAQDRAAELIREIPKVKKLIEEMRQSAAAMDNASLGSFRARCGLADAADALDFALAGVIAAFGAEP